MLLVIFCAIAALFAAVAAFSAYNKRKFYREHTQKMSAKVTSHRTVTLMGDSFTECDPDNIPEGFCPTSIAIHIGDRLE